MRVSSVAGLGGFVGVFFGSAGVSATLAVVLDFLRRVRVRFFLGAGVVAVVGSSGDVDALGISRITSVGGSAGLGATGGTAGVVGCFGTDDTMRAVMSSSISSRGRL